MRMHTPKNQFFNYESIAVQIIFLDVYTWNYPWIKWNTGLIGDGSELTNWSNLVAVMDWGGANSRFLGLVSVWAARSFDQTALRPSVIKRIRQIDVKYITHITSFGVTA